MPGLGVDRRPPKPPQPEKTEYITQGPDGQKRLRAGPDITSYRGLKVINSRSFSMEDGAPPRDVLRRRVRTAEYYRIPYSEGVESKHFSFYDESKDSWHKFSWHDLIRMADCPTVGEDYNPIDYEYDGVEYYTTRLPDRTGKDEETSRAAINDGINRLAAANLVPGAAVVPLPARPAPQGMPNPTRTNIKIPGGVFSAMKDPRNLTGFREDDVDLNGGANTWALLSELINRNVAYQIPLPFGAPPTRLDQVDAMGAWGVDATDLASAIQHKYQELASDICAFLLGDVRSMPWARREVLGRINFYDPVVAKLFFEQMFNKAIANVDGIVVVDSDRWEIVVIRPNIEHEMLGIVMGRGGVDELGATLWGQVCSPRGPLCGCAWGFRVCVLLRDDGSVGLLTIKWPVSDGESCSTETYAPPKIHRPSFPCTTTRCTGSGACLTSTTRCAAAPLHSACTARFRRPPHCTPPTP